MLALVLVLVLMLVPVPALVPVLVHHHLLLMLILLLPLQGQQTLGYWPHLLSPKGPKGRWPGIPQFLCSICMSLDRTLHRTSPNRTLFGRTDCSIALWLFQVRDTAFP